MLEIINDIKVLAELKPELDEIYHHHQGLSFSSPAFIINIWNEFHSQSLKEELFFILAKDKKKIVSYIPLYIDNKRTLRFIFDTHTDFCGIVGENLDFSFFKDLSKIILNDSRIATICFDNLLPESKLLNYFQHFFKPGVLISCYNNHSFISSTLENNFLSHLKSKEKSELKRIQNKNKEYDFEVFSGEKQFPEKEVRMLRSEMVDRKVRNHNFLDDSFINVLKDLYNAGEVEIYAKKSSENRLLSASFVLKNNKKQLRMVWIDLYTDIQFINLSSYIDYINYLEDFSPITFDFGRGSYDYKANNFQPQIQNLYSLRYSKSKYDFFFTNYFPLKEFVKRIVKG
ncbi:hypothetical protein [Flavobacterium croceum]|uniref:hypothetical protein n=1 Tax=Flavobacterium croceum TaxID=370975 RepID=UPI0024A8D1A9|nr:hypothetical protein [Flavobacterium croceum]